MTHCPPCLCKVYECIHRKHGWIPGLALPWFPDEGTSRKDSTLLCAGSSTEITSDDKLLGNIRHGPEPAPIISFPDSETDALPPLYPGTPSPSKPTDSTLLFGGSSTQNTLAVLGNIHYDSEPAPIISYPDSETDSLPPPYPRTPPPPPPSSSKTTVNTVIIYHHPPPPPPLPSENLYVDNRVHCRPYSAGWHHHCAPYPPPPFHYFHPRIPHLPLPLPPLPPPLPPPPVFIDPSYSHPYMDMYGPGTIYPPGHGPYPPPPVHRDFFRPPPPPWI